MRYARLFYVAIFLAHSAVNGRVYLAFFAINVTKNNIGYLPWYALGGPTSDIVTVLFDSVAVVSLFLFVKATASKRPFQLQVYRSISRNNPIVWYVLLNLAIVIVYIWWQSTLFNFPVIFIDAIEERSYAWLDVLGKQYTAIKDSNILANGSFQLILIVFHGTAQTPSAWLCNT